MSHQSVSILSSITSKLDFSSINPLDREINMKVFHGFNIPKSSVSKPQSAYSIRLKLSLYEFERTSYGFPILAISVDD